MHDSALLNATDKLIITEGGKPLIFDLVTDPDEQNPLASLPYAAQLEAAMARMRPAHGASVAPTVALDAATTERLRGLGYVQ